MPTWGNLMSGAECPLCAPRPDETAVWIKIRNLTVSTLYLDRNQTYRGHCQLVFDGRHVVGLENLTGEEFGSLMADLRAAARAIVETCQPDLMNYASLGNVMPHLHWHLVPRYATDPGWGGPIYTTLLADMPNTTLTDAEYRALIRAIAGRLRGAP